MFFLGGGGRGMVVVDREGVSEIATYLQGKNYNIG